MLYGVFMYKNNKYKQNKKIATSNEGVLPYILKKANSMTPTSVKIGSSVGAVSMLYGIYKVMKGIWNLLSGVVNKGLDLIMKKKPERVVTENDVEVDNVGNEFVFSLLAFPFMAGFFAIGIHSIIADTKKTKKQLKSQGKTKVEVIPEDVYNDIAKYYIGIRTLYSPFEEDFISDYLIQEVNCEWVGDIFSDKWYNSGFINTLINICSDAKQFYGLYNDKKLTINIIEKLCSFVLTTPTLEQKEIDLLPLKSKPIKADMYILVNPYERLSYYWVKIENDGLRYGMDVIDYDLNKGSSVIEEIIHCLKRSDLDNYYFAIYEADRWDIVDTIDADLNAYNEIDLKYDLEKDFGVSVLRLFFNRYLLDKSNKSVTSSNETIKKIAPLLSLFSDWFVDTVKLKILNNQRMYADIKALGLG